jgi:hypothetical protein
LLRSRSLGKYGAVVVSPDVARGHPRVDGASASKPGAELWFKKDVLENEEWMRDPTEKSRAISSTLLNHRVGSRPRAPRAGGSLKLDVRRPIVPEAEHSY